MAQITRGIRSLLSVPWVYEGWGKLLGGPQARAELVEKYLRVDSGDRVFDIGCGTGILIDALPAGVEYTGFDISEDYIEQARRHYGDAATFVHAAVGDMPEVREAYFDVAIANGVLHHLGDEEAGQLFELARGALRSGGRLITVDPVYVDDQRALARWLISKDRGQNVRREEEYEKLARRHFAEVTTVVRHDRLRIPYTHLIMECVR